MTIAVHISAGRQEDLSASFNFLCFSQLAVTRPESHFIFIFDSPPHPELYLEPNCTPVILPPPIKNNLLRHYWYNYKLPGVAARYNAEIIITSALTCSLRTNIPQCIVAESKDVVPGKTNLYHQRFVPLFLKKASHIFCTEPATFNILQTKYELTTKSSLLHPEVPINTPPLPYDERDIIKKDYAGGDEYFLYMIKSYNAENLKTVLKAFSIFKKWLRSSMRMVLIVKPELKNSIKKELEFYKYRDNTLLFCTSEGEPGRLISAAYSVIAHHAQVFDVILPALKSGVPVIASEDAVLKVSLSGILYTPWDEKSISDNMMKLYKDEHFRNALINEGLTASSKYSWKNTTSQIWGVFQDLLN